LGSAVNARLGTWQVPQLCCPDAERLASKNSALPATAAADALVVEEVPELVVEDELCPSPPPPQPASAAVIQTQ
jgi:hypothetical protein